MYNWARIIHNTLLPPNCILCGAAGWQSLDLCFACYGQINKNTLCCTHCACPLAMPNSVCGRCLSLPPAFDSVYAPFLYHSTLSYLIKALKYHGDYKIARSLGLLLANDLINSVRPDCLIPVPLHHSRYRQRGFNQAIEIARVVGKQLQIPLALDACVRHRDTPQQTRLTNKQRRRNIKNAFSLVKPLAAQHVVIIDDVMTTGATANELASVLKKSGVQRVDVWLCARA